MMIMMISLIDLCNLYFQGDILFALLFHSGVDGPHIRSRCYGEEISRVSCPYRTLYIDYAYRAAIVVMSLNKKSGKVKFSVLCRMNFLSPHVTIPETEQLDTPRFGIYYKYDVSTLMTSASWQK
jgi:hypothetical protein